MLASLVIGLVVSLVVVQRSLSADSENVIHDQAHKLGDNMLVIPAGMQLSDFYMFHYSSETLPQDYVQRLQSSSIGEHMRLNQARLYGNVEIDGVSLMIGTYLNVKERKPELAALFAIGSTGSSVLSALVLRSRYINVSSMSQLGR